MNNTIPIIEQLDNFMKQYNINLSNLAQLANMNAGTLSAVFNKNKILTVDHLDRLTKIMNLPDGYFYEQYIHDYLKNTTLNWRRIRPFLYRCVELNKLDCTQQVVNLLLESLLYPPLLFEVAEDCFQNSKPMAAALLFESVASSEKHQHSERLAFCQYRLFLLKQGKDQLQNYKAAVQFEPFIDRLNEIDQLDALKDLANTYRSLHKWNKLEEITIILEHKGKIQYKCFHNQDKKDNLTQKKPGRPLFFYLAYANLLRACVYEAQKNYKQALNFTNSYAELTWVNETDPDTIHWINLFQEWAQSNTYTYQLLGGDITILPKYIEYIEPKKDEILPALFNIIEAANRFNFCVDDILQRFESHINIYIEDQHTIGLYTDQIIANAFTDFLLELAIYYFHRNMYPEGFKYLLTCLELSSKINKRTCIIKSVGLFELYRYAASTETMTTYQNLVNEVYVNEKEKITTFFEG